MLRYNRRLKTLIIIATCIIILAIYCTWLVCVSDSLNSLPNYGKIELIDGDNIIIDDHGFSLDLDTFQSVGESQMCTFVFKNNNSAIAHMSVSFDYNDNYFRMDGIHSFEIAPSETYEYKVNIKLTDYPSTNEDFPFNIQFQTSYY